MGPAEGQSNYRFFLQNALILSSEMRNQTANFYLKRDEHGE